MSVKPTINVFASIIFIAMLGVSKSALPISTEASIVTSEGTQVAVQPLPLTQEDLEFLVGAFHARETTRTILSYLDQQEMIKTEGKVGPIGAVVGAVGGAAGYIGTTIGSGSGSTTGLVGATVAGAIGGFVMGPSGQIMANGILASQVGFYGGLVGGFAERAANSCAGCH